MALWGGRFSSETRNEVTQYSESISFDQRLYHFDIAGSKAHVTMLAEQGIIPAETAKAIREELDRIERRIDAGESRARSLKRSAQRARAFTPPAAATTRSRSISGSTCAAKSTP